MASAAKVTQGSDFTVYKYRKTQSLRAFVLFVFDVGGCRLRGLAADRLEEEALMEQYTLMEQQAALRANMVAHLKEGRKRDKAGAAPVGEIDVSPWRRPPAHRKCCREVAQASEPK